MILSCFRRFLSSLSFVATGRSNSRAILRILSSVVSFLLFEFSSIMHFFESFSAKSISLISDGFAFCLRYSSSWSVASRM